MKGGREYVNGVLRLLRLARPEYLLLGGSMVTLGVSTLTRLSVPAGIGQLVDVHNRPSEGDEVKEPRFTSQEIVTGLCGIFLVSAAATFGSTVLLRSVGERVVRRTRQQVFASLLRQPVTQVEGFAGSLASRLATDSQLLANAIAEHLSIGVRKVFESFGTFGVMLYLNPQLTGLMVVVLPVFGGVTYFGRWVKKKTEAQLSLLSEATELAVERLQGIRTVRAFTQEDRQQAVYSKSLDQVYEMAMKLALGSATVFGGTNLMMNSCFLLILYQGTSFVSAGTITMGELTSFLMYSGYLGNQLINH